MRQAKRKTNMTHKEYLARQDFEQLVRGETRNPEAPRLAQLLCRHGKTYHRVQEAICNGPALTPWAETHLQQERLNELYARHEAWCEKRERQLETRLRAIVASLGRRFGVIFSGDPRGATVKITVPSGRTNDWAREGICVPTA
jgi:hypothetical protein